MIWIPDSTVPSFSFTYEWGVSSCGEMKFAAHIQDEQHTEC